MRLLYLDWPHLPLRIEAARAGAAKGLPELVVIGGQPWEPGDVLDCSPAARRLGVRRGQPLGTAHRLVPEARFLPADREAYRSAMDAALDSLAAFTPALEGATDPAADGFGQVMLGIEGLHRLWGDEPTLCARVARSVGKRLPGAPRAGIGNTRFGAQVAAVVGAARARDARGARGTRGTRDGSLPDGPAPVEAIPAGDATVEAAYLARLPIRLLPADDDARE